ncbi:MAG TPA: SPOR domain-containing protein [Sphingomicrobium sp.]|nr:SPOR domain-containing protein [Sphingomicrobium sp.]
MCFRSGLAALLLSTLAFGVPAAAQYGATAIADPNAALAASMRTLAREPRNMAALISAGRASLELGDLQAAAGFFGRAEEAYPQSPMPKIGMGATMTMSGQPSSALTYFARAAALGAPPSTLALDRGMAYDLLGQQPQAQAEYRIAMIGVSADEARRRLALSLAIGRDFKGAAAAIEPLLVRRDREAIRVNAFILALAGDREGARRTIDSVMPGKGAQFEPFFRLLPVLRPNEKAAAVHLGEFPTDAAQRYAQAQPVASSPVLSIGNNRDPVPVAGKRTSQPRKVVQQQAPKPAPKRVAEAPRRAERESEAINTWVASIRPSLDPSRHASSRRPRTKSEAVQPAASGDGGPADPSPRPVVTAEVARPAESPPPAPPVVETVALDLPPAPVERQVETAVIDLPSDPLRPADNSDQDSPRPAFSVASAEPPPAPTPKLEINTPPAPKPKVELASRNVAQTRGVPAKPKADGPDVGAKGTHWVQLAGSSNKAMMASEYKKIRAKNPELFKGQPGHVTVGKDYFRLLVGPFDSAGAAQSFVTKLDKAGIDSFAWTRNPAQIKIEKLASR